jgi:hypothetical protein
MNELEESLRKKLTPLKIQLNVVYEDNIYYIVMDGRKTYQDSAMWHRHWDQGIVGFGTVFLKLENIEPVRSVEVDPFVVRYEIGSLFDLLKQ